MKVLALLRHAKAVKYDPDGDHARALSEDGHRAADEAGLRLRPLLPPGVLVIASDARRTRETAELAFPSRLSLESQSEPSLYLASSAALLFFVRSLPAEVSAAVLVGHNPGISELAAILAGDGEANDLARVAAGWRRPTRWCSPFRRVGTMLRRRAGA